MSVPSRVGLPEMTSERWRGKGRRDVVDLWAVFDHADVVYVPNCTFLTWGEQTEREVKQVGPPLRVKG